MKKMLVFLAIALLAGAAMADWGFWAADGGFTSVTINGTPQTLAAFDAVPTLGTFDLALDTMIFSAYSVNTWKNGVSDVNGVEYFYTVYAGARPVSPTFSAALTGGWIADLGGGDQTWGATGLTADILDWAGLAPGNTYTLEIYGRIQGNDDGNQANNYWKYDNNQNAPANYAATFQTAAAVPEPATMSLLGLGALAMVLRRKIRK